MTATTRFVGLRPLFLFPLNLLLFPIRLLIDKIEVKNEETARLICKLIPCNCPFERDFILFGKRLFHIPPMCKLNPLYNEFVGLRLRALNYLSDDLSEDVSQYIC
ncbi:MAG: Mo-dependent nitrogenase C-terminal domain-containing protein [Prochloraceae cyanobacterium]